MPRTSLVACLLLAVALAGCLSGGSAPADDADNVSSGDDPLPDNGTDVDGTDPAARSHVHDLWHGRSTIDLIDRPVNVSAARADATGDGPVEERVGPETCRPDSAVSRCLGRATVRPPTSDDPMRPTVVAPGTGTLRASVDWDADAITGVELAFVASDGSRREIGTLDEPGTVSVAAGDIVPNWTHFPLHWTDDGHATRSSWIFVVTAAPTDAVPGGWPAVAQGTVHLDVDAERAPGPLPEEPPHPDWYETTGTYLVGQAEAGTDREVEAWWVGASTLRVRVFPSFPVPPGTAALLVAARVDGGSPGPDVDALAADVTVRYSLHGGEQEGVAEVVDRTGDRIVFHIPVEDRMTDSLYACHGAQSSWRFVAETSHATAPADDPVLGEPVGAHAFQGGVNVTVAATERVDAGWDDLDPTQPEVPGCKAVRRVFDQPRPT